MRETPTISNTSYSNTVSTGAFMPMGAMGGAVMGRAVPSAQLMASNTVDDAQWLQLQNRVHFKETKVVTRIVKVFVADNDENLPLAKRVVYTGEEKLTDLTDQELFFELNVSEILKRHNEVRIQTRDKEQSNTYGRDIMLEPINIRDLRMVIVNIASF